MYNLDQIQRQLQYFRYLLLVFMGVLGCVGVMPAVAEDRDMSFSDPLRPYHWQGTRQGFNQSRLALQAIISGKDGSVAVINGRIVKVGDTLGALTVMSIDTGLVRLRSDRDEIIVLQTHLLPYPPISRHDN